MDFTIFRDRREKYKLLTEEAKAHSVRQQGEQEKRKAEAQKLRQKAPLSSNQRNGAPKSSFLQTLLSSGLTANSKGGYKPLKTRSRESQSGDESFEIK